MDTRIRQLIFRVKSFSPEKLFLFCAIPLGLLFLIVHPIGEVPDEFTHLMRIYGISEGTLIAEQSETNNGGSKLPSGLKEINQMLPEAGTYAEIGADLARPNSDDYEEYNYSTAAIYNPVCYLPQVLGILIGRIFNMPYVAQAYLGRLLNLIVFLILVYFSIKYIPKFKHWLMFLALLPISLQEASSLSPDALAIGLCFFIIGLTAHLAYSEKGKMSICELILLYIVAIVIGFCKIVYLPLLLIYFIIPSERFGSKKMKWIHGIAIAAVTIALNLGWLLVSSRYLANPALADVDSGVQLAHLTANPLRYLLIIAKTINARLTFYLTSGFGLNLGHFAIDLPSIFLYLSLIFATLILSQNTERLKIKPFERAVFILIPCIICILIFTSLYIQWTAVDAPIIDGVQGRYFLPFLPLLPFMLNNNHPKVHRSSPIRMRHIIIYLIIFNLTGIIKIFLANL